MPKNLLAISFAVKTCVCTLSCISVVAASLPSHASWQDSVYVLTQSSVQSTGMPKAAPANLEGAIDAVDQDQLATGVWQTCAVANLPSSPNRILCWGGDFGVLPKSVGNGLSGNVVAVGAGHACAITSGTVQCWGRNSYGQLGDGTTTSSQNPVLVQNLTGAVKLALGADFSCAIVTGGNVKCWGQNVLGVLGTTAIAQSSVPVDIPNVSGAKSITAGSYHVCAVLDSGKVKCWGSGRMLGNGTTEPSATPAEVSNVGNAIGADAGEFHTCLVTSSGAAKCWGASGARLGAGTSQGDALTPVDVAGLNTGVGAIAAGGDHACALMLDGSVRCWGGNYSGELGDGTDVTRYTPVSVAGISQAEAITAGGWMAEGQTCVRLKQGAIKCWGFNYAGQLGNGEKSHTPDARPVMRLPSNVKQVSAGTHHACAVTETSDVYCWGENAGGQLGNRSMFDANFPVKVAGVQAMRVVAGPYYRGRTNGATCVVTPSGGVKCWGGGTATGFSLSFVRSITPVDMPGLSTGISDVAIGEQHLCALLTDGTIKCLGVNFDGQLGNGSPFNTASSSPVLVTGLSDVASISANQAHTCVLTKAGGVKCWGDNEYGQLGDGSLNDRNTPVSVLGLSSDVKAISAGMRHTCAVKTDGTVWCWGDAQAFNGPANTKVSSPIRVINFVDNFAGIAASSSFGFVVSGHTCSWLSDGGVACWGSAIASASGIFAPFYSKIKGLSYGVISVSAGGYFNCAIKSTNGTSGAVWCWGSNERGELGQGSFGNRRGPVPTMGFQVPLLIGVPTQSTSLTGNFVSFDFPANTFSIPTRIQESVLPEKDWPPLPVGLVSTGTYLDLAAKNETTGDPVTPQGPFTLRMNYSVQLLQAVQEGSQSFYWWDGNQWVKEPTQVDTVNKVITANPNHLSIWTVMGSPNIPVTNIELAVSANAIIVGDTVIFTATVNTDATGVGYMWNFGDGSEAVTTSGNTVSHTYTTASKPLVSVMAQNGSSEAFTGVQLNVSSTTRNSVFIPMVLR
jgi:alpha-tubulin suppressor-like RCC1 family protein